MKNYVQNRSLITFVAGQNYTGGQPIKLGSLFGIAVAASAADVSEVLVRL